MKTIHISPSLFARNRQRLILSLKNNSLVIVHSNDEMNRTADQYYPFRQNSDLFYLTGINQEKTTLLLSPGYDDESMREILVIRRSNPKLETWEGHKLAREEAGLISGIKNVKFEDELDSLIAPLMMQADQVYLNLPEHLKFIPELPGRDIRKGEEIMKKFPAHHYERLAPVMRDLRVTKSEEEISLIKDAVNITRKAFLNILKTIRPGMMEYELEALITHDFIKEGARGHAYQPIIACGANACILHYIDNNDTCRNGQLLLMDFGAEYGNYAADCTRTFPIYGKFTTRQRDLYNSVLEVFKFARSLMVPGNTIKKLHHEVCRKFETEHIRLGLYAAADMKIQDPENPLYQKYYMHGTSHFLGLDVHDVGSKDQEFRPGMVLTCEPGLYLPAEQTGIRLENNILITRDGNVDLMKDIPIEPDEIEELMRKNKEK
jgi:Xaa-Pro aminopeptidase